MLSFFLSRFDQNFQILTKLQIIYFFKFLMWLVMMVHTFKGTSKVSLIYHRKFKLTYKTQEWLFFSFCMSHFVRFCHARRDGGVQSGSVTVAGEPELESCKTVAIQSETAVTDGAIQSWGSRRPGDPAVIKPAQSAGSRRAPERS